MSKGCRRTLSYEELNVLVRWRETKCYGESPEFWGRNVWREWQTNNYGAYFLFIYKFVLKSEKQCTFCPLNNCLIYLRHTCELQDKLEYIQLYIISFLLFPFSGYTKTPLISLQVAFFTSVL